MLILLTCPPQGPGETVLEYASRVLQFGIAYGPEYLTRAQLAQADHCAMAQITGIPRTPDQDEGRRYQLLLNFRRQLADDIERRTRADLQDARTLAALAAEQAAADDPGLDTCPTPGAQDTDEQRATRLLRAALVLIMQGGSNQGHQGNGNGNGDGGRGARLIPPPVTPKGPRTPSGAALAPEQATQAEIIRRTGRF